MNQSRSESYARAGVDITAGYRAVELMKAHIARTMTSGVVSGVGGFGGLFELDVRAWSDRCLFRAQMASAPNSSSRSF